MTTLQRVINFAAGPAVMPVPVLEEIQRDLLALPGVGMSVLEISHRSKPFEGIIARAEADIRTLAAVPANYKVLFLQGGASTQFSMVPMNLLTPGGVADYIDSGSWAEKAVKEAKKVGEARVAASTKSENYVRLPRQEELRLTPGAAYVHMTSNNTIEGTEYPNAARGGRRAARQRYLLRHVQPPDRRRAPRAHLRRCAEKHGPGRLDRRDHQGRPAGALDR